MKTTLNNFGSYILLSDRIGKTQIKLQTNPYLSLRLSCLRVGLIGDLTEVLYEIYMIFLEDTKYLMEEWTQL